MRASLLRRTIGLCGILALAAPRVALAAGAPQSGDPPDHSLAAELTAAGILLALSAVLYWLGGSRTIAKRALSYNAAGAQQTVAAGSQFDLAAAQQDTTVTLVRNTDYVQHGGQYFRGLLIGADNRWSTSKLQALMWTYAVLFGLLSLVLALAYGDSSGFDAQKASGLQEEYFVLLGGPFAAAVLAKYITTSKSDSGDADKTAEATSTLDPATGIGQVVSDDSGRGDLGDTQYFAFNLVALLYFFVAFCPHLGGGLPDLPSLLVGLTGLSAATYVAKKAVVSATPTVTSVVPSRGKAGDPVELWGSYLVLPPPTGQKKPLLPRVTIAGVLAAVSVVRDGSGSVDHLKIVVPTGIDVSAGDVETTLCVYTAVGTPAGSGVAFTVLA
jgi:hypothetical protein